MGKGFFEGSELHFMGGELTLSQGILWWLRVLIGQSFYLNWIFWVGFGILDQRLGRDLVTPFQ